MWHRHSHDGADTASTNILGFLCSTLLKNSGGVNSSHDSDRRIPELAAFAPACVPAGEQARERFSAVSSPVLTMRDRGQIGKYLLRQRLLTIRGTFGVQLAQGAKPQASRSGAPLKDLTKKLATLNSPLIVHQVPEQQYH
jgi:hypothetical protein